MKDNQIIISNDVTFDKDTFPLKKNFIEGHDPIFKELGGVTSVQIEVEGNSS
jgi:hypothetical protein